MKAWWCAWLAAFFTFVAVAHGNFETTDVGFSMHSARVLWQHGDSGLRRADQGGELPGEQAGAAYIHDRHDSGKVGTNGLAYPWFPMGHTWLLVPFVVLGETVGRAWPEAEARFGACVARANGPGEFSSRLEGTPVVMQGLICLLVPPAFFASTLLLLFHLARQFGADPRGAAWCAVAIGCATQAFAFGRETLSDGPGLTFLLAALLAVVAVQQGRGSWRTSLLGGLAGGASALLRYQNIALMLAVGGALAIAAWRQRRWRDLLAFTAGALPAMGLFLATNHARFGDAFVTGYPDPAAWFTEPIWLGAVKILFGAGRGVVWCSPLVWLGLPLALRARDVGSLRWLGWFLFLFPLLFFGRAQGWDGGRCWAARYVTHGLVALLAIALPQAQPWRRWPRAFGALVVLGIFVNLTSVVAPARGVQQLGSQAAAALGWVPDKVDGHDVLGWHPRFTPLLANWRYAFASRVDVFEDTQGRARHGAAKAIELVYGVDGKTDYQRDAPQRWEDRCGRHLWWRFWADVFDVSSWLLLLPVVALAAAFACLTLRRLRGASDSSTAR